MTKSRAAVRLRSGVTNTDKSGAFALLEAKNKMPYGVGAALVSNSVQPCKLASERKTPISDAEVNSGPYRTEVEGARETELSGVRPADTFVERQPG